MKIHFRRRLNSTLLIALLIGLVKPAGIVFAKPQPIGEFPQRNVWTRVSPSVVWCGDAQSKTTIEVHIVGRNDVRKVWVANLDGTGEDAPLQAFDDSSKGLEFFDDGSHGDVKPGDNVFTHSELVLPCPPDRVADRGWSNWWGYVRVELANGIRQGNNYGMVAGLVDPKYKNVFAVHDFGNHLSATAYAFFIEDSGHEVVDQYPVANVYCGTANYNAYKKLYSVLPDAFDIALVMAGMQIVRPKDLAENVPYDVLVSNAVQHNGVGPHDDTVKFGSSGRLKSVVYHSFGDISISTHEIGHTWGMNLGASLGLVESYGSNVLNHWSPLTDIGGQMGAYYSDGAGHYGHFRYNGGETWSFTLNTQWEPYSPLELYAMGMIPPEEVPPVHILQSPNLTDLDRITAASYKTVTIHQIQDAEGGVRAPSAKDSQKDFTLAFLVTQDTAYNDAAYAFFSLMSYTLMGKDPPNAQTYFSSFYWATGGRGTLNSRLPVDLADPALLPGMAAPAPSATITPTPTMMTEASSTATSKPANGSSEQTIPAVQTPSKAASKFPFCNCPLLVGGLALFPGAWVMLRRKRARSD
jgi:hypothetical protein